MNLKKKFGLNNESKPRFIFYYAFLGVLSFFIGYLFWKDSTRNSLADFIKDISALFGVLVFFYTLIGFVISTINWSPDIFHNVRINQKEKIKILSDFAKENWYSSDKTIFNELLNMLDRCKENKNKDVQLMMLMCTPALDYPERVKNNYSIWGEMFRNKIEAIIQDIPDVKLHLYYLPNENISGINPLYEFIESLSGFCASLPNSESSRDIFKKIKINTESFISYLENDKASKYPNIKIKEINGTDIPFQIFLYKSGNYCEVLVSFAGKTILQDEKVTKQKGFHSIDSDVVNAFEHIFHSYVANHRRIPIKPIHSLEIIDELNIKEKSHTIQNYLNLDINLKIDNGIFSPGYANSSKFTSFALTKILQFSNNVLDIGSGSGAQAIVSYKYLKEILKEPNPNVWAIEPCDKPYENLETNIKLNKANIVAKKWELVFKKSTSFIKIDRNINENIDTSCLSGALIDEDGNKISITSFSNIQFDIVIGDMPYVDTKADKNSDNDLELAFFDINHLTHQALFKLFAKADYLKKDCKLITSFSTLGGLDDIVKFERIIAENRLIIIQRFSFFEKGYLWYVYIILRNSYFESFNNEYWWRELNSRPTESTF